MKNIISNFTKIFLVALLFSSCVENMPVVPDPPEPPVGGKKVLVEEFTGVRCPNCPEGSRALEDLIDVYGENLVVVSIHAGDFVAMLPESTIDFMTEDGENLINYLGAPASYPSAVIDRRDFDGGAYRLQYTLSKWAGFIDEQINKEPKVTVNLEKNYDTDTRELNLEIFGVAAEDIQNEVRLTVMIAESNIVNAQDDQTQGGVVVDYNHKHVFRKTLTNFDGNVIANSLADGETYNSNINFTLPDEWKYEDCEVITFVTEIDGQNKEVLQADAVKIKD